MPFLRLVYHRTQKVYEANLSYKNIYGQTIPINDYSHEDYDTIMNVIKERMHLISDTKRQITIKYPEHQQKISLLMPLALAS